MLSSCFLILKFIILFIIERINSEITSTSPGSRGILKVSEPFLVIDIPNAGIVCKLSSIFFVLGFKELTFICLSQGENFIVVLLSS